MVMNVKIGYSNYQELPTQNFLKIFILDRIFTIYGYALVVSNTGAENIYLRKCGINKIKFAIGIKAMLIIESTVVDIIGSGLVHFLKPCTHISYLQYNF